LTRGLNSVVDLLQGFVRINIQYHKLTLLHIFNLGWFWMI